MVVGTFCFKNSAVLLEYSLCVSSHLFSTLSRKKEASNSQHGEYCAGDDDVECVVGGASAHVQVECDVREGFWTAGVRDDATHRSDVNQLPLSVVNVIAEVNVYASVCDVNLSSRG